MNVGLIIRWCAAAACGFASGGIMFARIIPRLFFGVDITKMSDDGNPGVFNAITLCGLPTGLLCLVLEMSKSAVPVYFAYAVLGLDTHSILFALVMAAPVLGHAMAPFDKEKGGKCISASFGVVIAMLPITFIGLLLAVIYIFNTAVIRISSHRLCSIITFAVFGTIAPIIAVFQGISAVGIGFSVISCIAVVRHFRAREQVVCDELLVKE